VQPKQEARDAWVKLIVGADQQPRISGINALLEEWRKQGA